MNTKTYIKRYLKEDLIILAIIGAIVLVPETANAQDDEQQTRPKHERILNHFDKDGDGSLNNREAYHARQFHKRWKESQGSDVRPEIDRIRDARRQFDRNNDGRLGPRERTNARRAQARRNQ